MAGPALLRPGPPPPPPPPLLLLLSALLPLGLGLGPGGPACGARVDVRLRRPQASYTLQGALLGGPPRLAPPPGAGLQGRLVLVGDKEPQLQADDDWIGVVPVGEEQGEAPGAGSEESFTSAVVSKVMMKRALVLGASALLILALNQNAVRELDVSQVLSKPVIVVQMSDNVTKLLSALLGGLQATAKITSQAVLLENVGLTLTLWSSCGLSRGGLYGEWQGVICPGESGSRVQLDLRQHILRTLSALKTRRYHPGRPPRAHVPDIQTCAICLDPFHRNQCLRVLPCLHEFHRECVDPWLLLQQTCPLCKHNILGSSWADS
ncbi:RING finger protein 215 isoform X3 [Antechinus flavipes]|uniref:RING finger protein 215 isoform X3 n=1 Tax=Antechinus flavipes TaxID=38775 RepID=UPI0022360381|nr:RING finger protein 215 isoform X3 [Antechinus flavipes]